MADSAGDREFPVPFAKFAKTLVGTPDEVWTKLVKIRHGREKHTPTEWRKVLNGNRHQPAHRGF